MSSDSIFSKLMPVNVGTVLFKDEIIKQGKPCIHVEWKPVAGGNKQAIDALDKLFENAEIDAANQEAVDIIKAAHPILIDMAPAIEVIPGMTDKTILHAGPPIEYERMCGPMKGAIIGALVYEGLAPDLPSAERLASSKDIIYKPCHELNAVGPMAGIISPTMPVHVVKNNTHGNLSFATVNEGLGKVLRYGANSDEVIKRLNYIKNEFAPVMKAIIKKIGGIDLKSLTAQALHMGDECHNRNKAATTLFIRELIPYFMEDGSEAAKTAMQFICGNDHYYLNLSMAACKCSLEAAQGIKNSTVVTTMARNGVDFGIRVSGSGKNQWYVGEAQYVQGLFFPGFTQDDASRDIGDSAITETMGIGGFAMAAAPSIVQFVGGSVDDAIGYSNSMFSITAGENPSFSLPPLDFRGSAIGIDIRKVVSTGILPIINTGMAHRNAGIGQVGAGLVHPPMDCFTDAVIDFGSKL